MQSMKVWSQSRNGRAVDLIIPRVEDVDFREIADTLSLINRYAGCTQKPISVAQHTLIALDAAEEWVKPYVVLHDAHEARFGDIVTPAAEALDHFVEQLCGSARLLHGALAMLKKRHDDAIMTAAKLPLPCAKIGAAVRRADTIALQTERRDFLAKSKMPWGVDALEIAPLPKVYRLRPAPDVADDLYLAFRKYLPVFASPSPAATSRVLEVA